MLPLAMLQNSRSVRRPGLQYCLLGLLFLITAAYQLRHIGFVVDSLRGKAEAVTRPFAIPADRSIITSAGEEGRKAGVRPGDTLMAVNGHPYEGEANLNRALNYAHPGDLLTVTVRHKTGNKETLHIPLVYHASPEDRWYLMLALGVVLPLSCVLLGFWVAAVRPGDPMAWLLLALLLGFGGTFGFGSAYQDGTLISSLALAYRVLLFHAWFIWIFLLGLYFPTPLAFERRIPWLKWLLIVPLAVRAVLLLTELEWGIRDYSFFARIPDWLNRFNSATDSLRLAAIVLFFAAIGAKYAQEHAPDARRRLRLLYAGMFLALVPLSTLLVIDSFTGKRLQAYPAWIELPCLLMTLLFPLTLAYLILVHRALDVRVVIRQGLQYALARRGVIILQAVLSAVLFTIVAVLVTSHAMSTVSTILLMAAGLWGIFLLQGLTQRLASWIDRRFFREAYDAERILADLSESVRTIMETRPLLETVARRIAESLHVERVAVLIDGSRPYQPAYALGHDDVSRLEFPDDSGTVRQLRQAREPVRVYLDDPNSWIYSTPGVSAEERAQIAALQAELLLPLAIKDKLLGFISLGQKRSEEPYSGSDLSLLKSVASQTGLALENARLTAVVTEAVAHRERLNRELEIAREVQQRLFPQELPPVPGLDYAGMCRPAQGVGGDYYDFLQFSDGSFGIAIGDVSGKGISAALMMASLQASLRGQTLLGADDLAGVVARVNRLLYEVSSVNRYATFFFARYSPATRQLSYVNAGHNPPMLLRGRSQDCKLARLDLGGAVIGLLRQVSYRQGSTTLDAGDLLVLFTDGITETMNPADEEWGEDRLLKAIEAGADVKASAIIGHIMNAADAFASGAKQHDDMTLVVLKVCA
jgi:phosphoserine phosphatase RsbU/P